MSAVLGSISSRSEYLAISFLLGAVNFNALSENDDCVDHVGLRGPLCICLGLLGVVDRCLCHRATCTVLDHLEGVVHAVLWEANSLLHDSRNITNPFGPSHSMPRVFAWCDGSHASLSTCVTISSQSPHQTGSTLCGSAIGSNAARSSMSESLVPPPLVSFVPPALSHSCLRHSSPLMGAISEIRVSVNLFASNDLQPLRVLG